MPWNDIRYALRLMRRSPGFTAVAVLSLALGIGANTAIYSLFYTIMVRPLAVSHPEQLVELVRNTPDEFHWAGYWGWEKYVYFRDHNDVFTGITGVSFDNLASVRTEGSGAETLIEENVPGNYFRVLGLKPAIGRLIGPEDVPARGDGDVAVVSWSYWNRRFHRDPGILGSRIFYNDAPKTVIGVAPRAYAGPRVGSRTDLWIPVEHNNLTMIARLKPGVPIERAQAEIDVLYRAAVEQNLERRKDGRMELLPAGAGLAHVRDQYGKPLALLLAVVGLLLLLACINMASMLLARSAGRQRELAVRIGLGASRGRLVQQMLTESVLLSGAGAMVGVLAAYLATGVLVRIMASGRAFEHIDVAVQPDLHLLVFTAATGLITGLLFGLAPAWHAFRAAPASRLRQSGRIGDTWFWRLFGKGLVASQVALSILLVTAAAIFLGHLSRLRHFDLGFRSDHVLLVTLDPSHSGYKPGPLAASYRELLSRLGAIPGVHSASISGCTPLQGCGSGARYVIAEGHVERPEDRQRPAVAFVAPRYFETLGIPLLAGRDFSLRDTGRPRAAIVSMTVARHFFPGVNPIGRHVTIVNDPFPFSFGDNQPYEIIGVAGDVKLFELRDAQYPVIYFNMFQENHLVDQFELRTSGRSRGNGRHGAADCRGGSHGRAREASHNTWRASGLEHRSRAPDRNVVGVLRRPGSGSRGNWVVRAPGVYRGAADQRDRSADGAGSVAGRCGPDGVERCPGDGVCRRGNGGAAGGVEQAAGCRPGPGSETGERRSAGFGRWGNCRSRADRLVCPGAPGNSRRPDGSATPRVESQGAWRC